MPKQNRVRLLLSKRCADFMNTRQDMAEQEKKCPAIRLLEKLQSDFSVTPDNVDLRQDLEQFCQVVIRETKAWKTRPSPYRKAYRKITSDETAPFSDEVISSVCESFLGSNPFLHFSSCIKNCSNPSPGAVCDIISTLWELPYELTD